MVGLAPETAVVDIEHESTWVNLDLWSTGSIQVLGTRKLGLVTGSLREGLTSGSIEVNLRPGSLEASLDIVSQGLA